MGCFRRAARSMPITGPQRSETAYAWALSVQGLLRVDLAGLYCSLQGVDQPAAGIDLRAAGLRPVAVARTRQSALDLSNLPQSRLPVWPCSPLAYVAITTTACVKARDRHDRPVHGHAGHAGDADPRPPGRAGAAASGRLCAVREAWAAPLCSSHGPAPGLEFWQIGRDAKIFRRPVGEARVRQIESEAIEFLRQSMLADGGLEGVE